MGISEWYLQARYSPGAGHLGICKDFCKGGLVSLSPDKFYSALQYESFGVTLQKWWCGNKEGENAKRGGRLIPLGSGLIHFVAGVELHFYADQLLSADLHQDVDE